ncbi:MAG: NHLP leader peptide family RiPP precursor [Defluviitaleaceae bacterium]|nr:NHLP leader peptide family RiPP precursor [Defluviitaleaceae bacterium]
MWDQNKINEICTRVQTLATDEAFRAEMLQNPTEVIEKIAGESIPENFTINVIEDGTTNSISLALQPMMLEELSDNDLEDVAGGGCSLSIFRMC